MKKDIKITVNNKIYCLTVNASRLLIDVLREDLNLKGTKLGCGEGECGACTVICDGQAINSCLYLAVEADGKNIVTIEGLAPLDQLHPLQEAFIKAGAAQCGYCTPGMILSAKALLDENPQPLRAEIKTALAGNFCRCTGYNAILRAVESVVEKGKR